MADPDIVALQRIVSDSGLERLDAAGVAQLRREHAGIPDDYVRLLSEFGYGGIEGARFMLYSGPVRPTDIFDPATAAELPALWLVGDDFAGWHLGYLLTGGAWRVCFFSHTCLSDIQPVDEASITRFLISLFDEDIAPDSAP